MDNFSISQGVEITVIGIGVVFAGLILTYLMINLFSLLPKAVTFLKSGKPDPGPAEKPVFSGTVPGDHLAVIAAVLDIEIKMKNLLDKGRFTFK